MWCLCDLTPSGWCKTNALSTDFVKTQKFNEDGTPPRKGIKIPSKLLSPKYQSQSSLGEQNKNSTSPKRVHFVNTNTVLSKDDKPGEKGIIKPITMDDDHDVIVKVMKECKKSEEGKEEKGDPENINTNPPSPPNPSISFITEKYNWIMRKQLKPGEYLEGISGISNFTRIIKGMHIFVRNFTLVSDFMIVENISSIIEPRLSQVVIGKPFLEISNMTYDLSLRVVKFINETNEIFYKIPYKIEQYNSLSNLEKEHTKLVYLRNEDDKRREVEYVMNKILGFYKECLELGPEYLNGLEDEGEVT
nr:retrotransposon Orf1 [Tanacetum cinerariifolium]